MKVTLKVIRDPNSIELYADFYVDCCLKHTEEENDVLLFDGIWDELSGPTKESVREMLEQDASERDPKNAHFVVLMDGTPVGILRVYEYNKNMALIHDVYVVKDYRHKGVMKQALTQIRPLCSRMEFKFISVNTYVKNTSAIALYRKVGFKDDMLTMTDKL